jgi:hypothetical protein
MEKKHFMAGVTGSIMRCLNGHINIVQSPSILDKMSIAIKKTWTIIFVRTFVWSKKDIGRCGAF